MNRLRNIDGSFIKSCESAFGDIFSKPVHFQHYADYPGTVSSVFFTDINNPLPQRFTVHELGCKNRLRYFSPLHVHRRIIDGYLHDLSNVIVYKGIICAPEAVFFLDSLNWYAYHCTTPSLGRATSYRPTVGKLQKNVFILNDNPQGLSSQFVTAPLVKFHTWPEYGHYLLSIIPYLGILEKFSRRPRLLIHQAHESVPRYLLDMCRPFAYDESSFIIAKDVTVCEKLLVPSKHVMSRSYIGEMAKRVWATVRRYYTAANSGSGLNIYVSRKYAARRPLVNELQCENFFKNLGFTVIHPEFMSFPEQVAVFAEASHIVGPIGSALHNIVFSSHPDTVKLLTLVPDGFNAIAAIPNVEYAFKRRPYFVFGRYLKKPYTVTDNYAGPWSIDLPDLHVAAEAWLKM